MQIESELIPDKQLTTDYLASYESKTQGKLRMLPGGLIQLPFSAIVSFVQDARQFESLGSTPVEAGEILNLEDQGLDDETLAEAFLPFSLKKFETMAGHTMRRRIFYELTDIIEISMDDLTEVIKKSRDFGNKHLLSLLDIPYLRAMGFMPVVKDPCLIKNGIITPDNIDIWLPR